MKRIPFLYLGKLPSDIETDIINGTAAWLFIDKK